MCRPSAGKLLIAHWLREAWRAQQWQAFLASKTHAALALNHLTWTEVRERAKRVEQILQKPRFQTLHAFSIVTGKWVSQAKHLSNQNEDVPSCWACGHKWPNRAHEWICPALREKPHLQFKDALEATLAWPKDTESEELLADLIVVREKLRAHKYGAAD